MSQPRLSAHAHTGVARVLAVLALSLVLLLPAQATPAAVTGGAGFDGSFAPFNPDPAPPGGVAIVSSPVEHGSGALRSVVQPGNCRTQDQNPDGSCKRYHSQATWGLHHNEGADEWWGWSIYFPGDWKPNVTSYNKLGDFHGPSGSTQCQTNISMGVPSGSPSQLFVKRQGGASCTSNTSASKSFPVGALGRWHRLVYHIKFSSSASGRVEAWWDGTKVADLAGPNLYAAYDYAFGPKIGIYQGAPGAIAETVYYDHVLSGTSFEDVAGSSSPPPPDSTPPPDPTPPPSSTPPPAFTVTTPGVTDGQTVSGAVRWEAVPAGGTVDRVEFLIDGQRLWTDRRSPYVFNGDTGKWDTTTATNGAHTLKARAYATDGRTAASTKHVTVANAAHPPDPGPPPVTSFTVSTLGVAEGDTLSGPARWEAVPSGATISRVVFLIDGQQRWTERSRPYVFNGDTGTWNATLEAEGDHTLVARAVATDGRTASSTVHVHVVKPPISFAQAPRLSGRRRVAVQAAGPAGSAIVATVRAPSGRKLGRATGSARADGAIRLRVRLHHWRGQRPLYVAMVSPVDGALARATSVVALPQLAYARRPRILRSHRLRVRATALPGSAVDIVVRGLHGRFLGAGHTTAHRSGAVSRRVVLRHWAGQRYLRVIMRTTSFEDGVTTLHRVKLGVRLLHRELRRARLR